jgi:hypothetical protein
MEISSNLFSTEVVYSLEMARSFILQEGDFSVVSSTPGLLHTLASIVRLQKLFFVVLA